MPKAGNPQTASTAAVSSKEEEVASQSSSASGSSCTACLRCFRRVIPVGFKEELYQLLCLAGPVFVSQLMISLIGFVSTVFCGHLGKPELASVALSIAVINISGISVGTGLASTCDTLISQTYGSGNLKRVGVILQRSILILLLFCFPCWALLINTESLLLAVRQNPEVARMSQLYVKIFMPALPTYGSGNLKRVGVILQRSILILLLFCFPCWALLINTESLLLAVRQNPEVARMSQLYVKIFMPALPATFIYQLQGRYLQNQGIIWPQVITGAIGNVINALINYIFLYVLDLGVAGSAGANVISQFILMVLLFGYIHWKKLHKDTWAGGVSGGIVRGVGRQKFGAICNLFGYYVVGLPVGVSLMFAMHMGIVGLWSGMLLSVAMQAVFFNIFIVKLDWKKVTQEALVRAGVQTLRDGRENEVYVNGIDSADPSPDSKAEEEMAMEDLSPSHIDTEGLGNGRAEGSMSPVGGILSLQQLVLRRGLAVIGGLLILAAGIIVNVTLTEFTWHSNSTVSPDTGSNATQHRF
ncbi:UNVERIFIED_CONTAM: hypothetical protein FKN15_002780 [Acipenser sinensis]